MIATARHGDILLVTAANPPVNALGAAVRQGLVAAIREAEGDAAVRAVVIACAGRTFFAGADITEFGKPPVAPVLPEVVDIIEGCAKPVVAAIHGTALGGGLEVAMACHARVAVASAKLGLPEVKLGLLPGAGGTQRLPRLVGVGEALAMVVSGDPIPAAKAVAIGLVDEIVAVDLIAGAIAYAAHAVVRRTSGLPVPAHDPAVFDDFRRANARRFRGFIAPESCLRAVKAAAELPYAEGIVRERALFMELFASDQSKALRHIFFAERTAAKIDGLAADTALLPVTRVGIIGAGTMGGGIAMNFLSAGVPVTMVEREQAALDRGVAVIRRNYENSAKRGRMTADKVEAAMALLTPTMAFDDLAPCDLVVEAVFEEMAVKREVFGRLDAIMKPGAILATNTSYLDVDAIADATSRPDHVVGLHFFSPANVMRLLEVVKGAKTAPAVLATAMGLARRIGKVAVVSGVCHGFIGNRMLAARQTQANALILEGASPWDVDRVATDFGFPMGPFQMADLAGLDLGWNAERSTGETVRDVLCEGGRRGQKTGKGFYDYDAERNRTPSPETEAIIAGFFAKSGKPARAIDDREIMERLFYPMVNEGARILEEGVAQRASDIDTVWINGYGWPAWTGGPMFWADTIGAGTVLAGLERHAAVLGETVVVSPLLRERAAAGAGFN